MVLNSNVTVLMKFKTSQITDLFWFQVQLIGKYVLKLKPILNPFSVKDV